ncbi:YcnI family protein [Streptomyces sp. NBC_00841]|uniref:YcnI family copper-binding membrane protein n=1 Tax=unclassified Streptomyces TaxID=2593676 RepID=UPI002253BD40|nr:MULTISPECIES: YcnI family protein [unclassified Streptomyces]MCX4533913.1 YcnI family protein [Streptomyces sp. NBC_01669]WSA00700.1 YcnI family protein [Streptomyces sp. NBC_00841]
MNLSRIAVVGGVAASTVLILAGTASAHVSVQPQGEAAKGGYATINFKVPNERDDASTTKLEVNFPTDHPLASVMPQPVPGWKIDVTRSKLAKPLDMHGQKINEAVSKVTWTAEGSKNDLGIRPGEFQQFPLSVGQLPEDADQLVFKAIQTYDNKDVVRWIEEQKDGAEEPESPAPVLKLTAATTDEHGSTADDKSGAATAAEAKDKNTEAASASSSSDTTARVLGVVGIVIGIAGVAFGVLAGRRRTA